MKLPIYLDYQATTPVDPRVLDEMLPYFGEVYGNAASRNHSFGWAAEEAVDKAREHCGQVIGASSKEIVFTSGSTEAINLAIKGVAGMYGDKGKHIITSQAEHKAELEAKKVRREQAAKALAAKRAYLEEKKREAALKLIEEQRKKKERDAWLDSFRS